MEHSYKKAAAAIIALALIAAVVCGIIFAAELSPTIPSGEGSSSLATTDAQIASDVSIGTVDQVLNPGDQNAVREHWGMPDAQVVSINSEQELKNFLHASDGSANKIGVLLKSVSYSVSAIGDIGTGTFRGVLDGNGHTISLDGGRGVGEINTYAFLNSDEDGIRENLEVGSYAAGIGINGINAAGLMVGANRGTIANVTIDYTSSMDLPTLNTNNGRGSVSGSNLMLSGQNPAYMSSYGIIAGANFGNITNVRLNVNDNFIARQQASSVNNDGSNRDGRSIENTAIVGTLAGILVNGSISDTYVNLGSGIYVAATADGRPEHSSSAWRNAIAITGGMVGFFIGSGGALSDSYLTGTGTVRSTVFRGENDGIGKGYNCYSGGITAGKFKINDGLRDDGTEMIVSSGSEIGDINAQIQGIVVSWRGMKEDNHNFDDSGAYEDDSDFALIRRSEPGTLIDTANHQGRLAIALTYDYDSLFDGLDGTYAKTGISNTGNVKDWVEVYSTGGDTANRVEVSVADGSFRIQAVTDDYSKSSGYTTPIENLPDETRYLSADSTYTGEFIWELYQTKPTEESASQDLVVQDYTRYIGAMVYMLSYSGTQAAYEIRFGTIASYSVDYKESGVSRTAMMYDGSPANTPILSLTAAGDTVSVDKDSYQWAYMSGDSEVTAQDTMYPGTYTFFPRYNVTNDQGEVTATYAYLDTTNRVVARSSQGKSLTFNVLPASFTVTSAASNGAWTKQANFNGVLDTSNYAVYGQTAPSGEIFDAFTYVANNSVSAYQPMSGYSFSFSDTATTATAGRVYNGFTAYKLNSAGEYVAVGTARASLTVRIDNAAPILTGVRYYTYSGDLEASQDTMSQHYFNIKNGDPAYTDVTAEISDGGWTSDELFVVITASDERRSGVDTIAGAGIQIELQTSGGTSLSRLSPQLQINYGSEESGGDLSLGSGNAAAIGYIANSYTLKALLVDTLGNSNNSSDSLGTLNVDTTELKLNSVSAPEYSYGRAGSRTALILDFGESGIQVGPSGAEIMYMVVDKEDIDGLSTEVPAGYENEWVSLGDYVSGTNRYTIYESYSEGAAIFVRLVSKQGLYDDCVTRLYATSGRGTDKLEDGRFPYFYVDLVTMTLYVPDSAIIVDGVRLSEITDLSAAFAKQYDGSDELLATTDPDGATVDPSTGRIVKSILIDWDAVTQFAGSEQLAAAKSAILANGFSAVGRYSQYEGVGDTVLTWSFEVGNAAGDGYKYELLFGTQDYYTREKEVATVIDYRDYNIGVEGLVKYDPDFAQYLVYSGDVATNEVKTTYWGTNANPFPYDFHYPTGFGDDLYFRYAYVGGTDGVFDSNVESGAAYWISVDAVQIVPEGTEPTEDGWQEFTLDANGSGDLPQYDNYNFHFTTAMKLTVEKVGVNITTSLSRVEIDAQGGQTLVPESLSTKIAYDGFTHIVGAQYRDIYGNTQDAVVTVWMNAEHTLGGEINAVASYYIVVTPTDTVNYYIRNNAEQVFEVVSTTIDIDTTAQEFAYNNGKAVNFVLKDGDGLLLESVMPASDSVEVIYYNEAGLRIDPIELGEYEVQIVYTAGAGSTFSTARFASTLTIVKATPEIVGMSDNSLTYDKSYHTYSDPADSDELKLVSANLYPETDGEYFEFGNLDTLLVLQYYDSDAGEWRNVDMLNSVGAGNFVNAGTYTYRYYYAGDAYYNEVWSNEVTFTIQRAVYGSQDAVPEDFLIYKDNTSVEIPKDNNTVGNDSIPDYTTSYNAKSQYLTAKSATFFAEDGTVLEPGAEIIYTREGSLFETARPEALNMVMASTYRVTVYIRSDNYEEFRFDIDYVITPVSTDAITVVTDGGSDITSTTSADDPQLITATYDGKEHGYLDSGLGEIRVNFDSTKLLEYNPDDPSASVPGFMVNYYPDAGQSNTMVNAGSYSGYYMITVGFGNYEPIYVYVDMTISPVSINDIDTTVDDTIKEMTTDTNVNNIISATFDGVDGSTEDVTLIFVDKATGNEVKPNSDGQLPAGEYDVKVQNGQVGNYDIVYGETIATLTIVEADKDHVHVDVNNDNKCDDCGANVSGIHVHVDADGDGVCDNCGESTGSEPPHRHVDANGDGICDSCGQQIGGTVDPGDPTDPTDPGDGEEGGMDTPTLIAIVCIVAAAVVIVGTVVGVVLIVRKKRRNVI